MDIFCVLSASRQNNGFGPCPISITDIIVYLQMKSLIMDLDSTIDILQKMDRAFIKFNNIKDD